MSLVVIALVQAAAAEAVFALFRYRRWTLGVTILAALAIGVVYNFYLLFFYYQAFSFFSPRRLIGTACELLSALVFAGFGSWGPVPRLVAIRRPGSLRLWTLIHAQGGIHFVIGRRTGTQAQARICCPLTGLKSHASSPTFTLRGSVPSGTS